MVDISEKDLALLDDINKEKFKRRLSLFRAIGSRVLALFLILAILYVGWVYYVYASDIREIKQQYGTNAYCYLCGVENLKRCSCEYITTYDYGNIPINNNISEIQQKLGEYNTRMCPSYEQYQKESIERVLNSSKNISLNE